MTKACRVCGQRGKTYIVSLDLAHKNTRRQYLVEVCQGCWRVFEVMLDEAAVGMQPHLSRGADPSRFLV